MKRSIFFVFSATCALLCAVTISAVYAASTGEPVEAAREHPGRAGHQGSAGFLGATPTPCIVQYVCTVTPGATIVPGTTDTGNHTDDGVTNVTLPFPFTLYGTGYNSVNVSSNGNAQFVSTNT